MKTSLRFGLAVIVLAGLLLRLWGVSWGLPARTDLHPDEHDYVIEHALQVSWQHPDPGFINYPSFLCYSTALIHGLHKVFDPERPDWKAYLTGRRISAGYGALTILLVFALARRLGGSERGALLAALATAVLPLHVWDSHVAVTDVMMTFWTLATLLAALRLQATPTPGAAALAGLCLGLATGSKYTAAVTCVAPLTALLLTRLSWPRRAGLLALTAVVAVGACFAVTPFSLIRFHDTLAALAYENAHTHGHHIGFSVPADGFQYHHFLYQLLAAWPFSFGLPLYLLAIGGAVWFVLRGPRSRWLVLAFAALFFLLTGSMSLTPLRYYLPLVVLGALVAGLGADAWLAAPGSRRARWGRALLLSAIAAHTLAFTLSTTRRYGNDTRIAAHRWLETNIRPGEALHTFGWSRYCATLNDGHTPEQTHLENKLIHVGALGTNDLIQVTSLHYLRWQRHGDQRFMSIYRHLRANRKYYDQVAVFDQPFLHRDFYGLLDPMFRTYFVSPTVEIYRHRGIPPAAAP